MPKRNKISPFGLFCLVYLSRIVVSLTAVSSMTYGAIGADLLISLVISLGLTLVLSLPAVYCYAKGKNPFDNGFVGLLYLLFFIFLSSVNISRFSYFASTTLNPETKAWLFVVIIAVCAWYCCKLGIEALTRFAGFAFLLTVIGIIFVVSMNIKGYREINLYPVVTNSTGVILRNAVILSSNTAELAYLLCLKDRVNGYALKSFVGGIIGAYATLFTIILIMLGIMGDGARLEDFPVFTLFQMTKINYLERLDVLHISFWITGIFIKTVLLQYCAAISIKRFNMNKKCTVIGVITFALTVVMLQTGLSLKASPIILNIPFWIFCVLIPLITLVFGKRKSTNEAN